MTAVSPLPTQQTSVSNEKVAEESQAVEKSTLTASVGDISESDGDRDKPLYKWLFALIVIVIGGSSSALFLRKQASEEITIID